jgi:signal peptidase I
MTADGAKKVSVPFWQRVTVGRSPMRTLVRAAALGALCWFTAQYLLLPMWVAGISMEPTYRDGSVNVVNRLPYFWRDPRRGEVVGIKTTGLKVLYLKRVIGLPGETILIAQGVVQVDGQPLAEPYVKDPRPWEWGSRKLGPDEYLVIGDNRTMDQDQHAFGVVKRAKIAGKVLW